MQSKEGHLYPSGVLGSTHRMILRTKPNLAHLYFNAYFQSLQGERMHKSPFFPKFHNFNSGDKYRGDKKKYKIIPGALHVLFARTDTNKALTERRMVDIVLPLSSTSHRQLTALTLVERNEAPYRA